MVGEKCSQSRCVSKGLLSLLRLIALCGSDTCKTPNVGGVFSMSVVFKGIWGGVDMLQPLIFAQWSSSSTVKGPGRWLGGSNPCQGWSTSIRRATEVCVHRPECNINDNNSNNDDDSDNENEKKASFEERTLNETLIRPASPFWPQPCPARTHTNSRAEEKQTQRDGWRNKGAL